MAKMRISPELKKLIEKYRCVKDTEGMSPAKVYKLVGENENLYLKMTDSRYKGTTYDVEREKGHDAMAGRKAACSKGPAL